MGAEWDEEISPSPYAGLVHHTGHYEKVLRSKAEVGEQKGAKDQPWGRQGREPESIMTMTAIRLVIYGGPTSSGPCAHIGWTWLRVCQVQKGEQFRQGKDVSEGREEKDPLPATQGSGAWSGRMVHTGFQCQAQELEQDPVFF